MDCFEEYKGFLEVAFAILDIFFGLTAPATALRVLVNCFFKSWICCRKFLPGQRKCTLKGRKRSRQRVFVIERAPNYHNLALLMEAWRWGGMLEREWNYVRVTVFVSPLHARDSIRSVLKRLMSTEVDLAESGLIGKVFIKGRDNGDFLPIPPSINPVRAL